MDATQTREKLVSVICAALKRAANDPLLDSVVKAFEGHEVDLSGCDNLVNDPRVKQALQLFIDNAISTVQYVEDVSR